MSDYKYFQTKHQEWPLESRHNINDRVVINLRKNLECLNDEEVSVDSLERTIRDSRRVSLKTLEWLNGKVEILRRKFSAAAASQNEQEIKIIPKPKKKLEKNDDRKISLIDGDLMEICNKYQVCGLNKYTWIAEPFENVVSEFGNLVRLNKIDIHRGGNKDAENEQLPRGILLLPLSDATGRALLDFSEMGGFSLGRGSRVAKSAMQSLSRSHCLIYLEDNRVYIKDCDSKSGTFVCGKLLGSSVPTVLNNFDFIQLGYGAGMDDSIQSMVIFLDGWNTIEFASSVQKIDSKDAYTFMQSNSADKMKLETYIKPFEFEKEKISPISIKPDVAFDHQTNVASPKLTQINSLSNSFKVQKLENNANIHNNSSETIIFERPRPVDFEQQSRELYVEAPKIIRNSYPAPIDTEKSMANKRKDYEKKEMEFYERKSDINCKKDAINTFERKKYTDSIDIPCVPDNVQARKVSIAENITINLKNTTTKAEKYDRTIESPQMHQNLKLSCEDQQLNSNQVKIVTAETRPKVTEKSIERFQEPVFQAVNEKITYVPLKNETHSSTQILDSISNIKNNIISTPNPPVPKPRKTKAKNLSKSLDNLIEVDLQDLNTNTNKANTNSVKLPMEKALAARKPSIVPVINVEIPEFLKNLNSKIPTVSPVMEWLNSIPERQIRKFTLPVQKKRMERMVEVVKKRTQFTTVVQGAFRKRYESFVDFGTATSDISDGWALATLSGTGIDSLHWTFNNFRTVWKMEALNQATGNKLILEARSKNDYNIFLEGKQIETKMMFGSAHIDVKRKFCLKFDFKIDEENFKSINADKQKDLNSDLSLPLRALEQLTYFYPHLEVPSLLIEGIPDSAASQVTLNLVTSQKEKDKCIGRLNFEMQKISWSRRSMAYAVDLDTSIIPIDSLFSDVIQSAVLLYCLIYHID